MVAEFDRIADRARLQPQPALGGRTHHDGAVIVEQQHRAVEQLLVARQRDREVLSAPRRARELAPLELGARTA